MRFPTSTGGAAQFLGATEPRLNDLIRKGRIRPAPSIMAGRRLWQLHHLREAARHLGLLDDELEAKLREEVGNGT